MDPLSIRIKIYVVIFGILSNQKQLQYARVNLYKINTLKEIIDRKVMLIIKETRVECETSLKRVALVFPLEK